MSERVSFYIDGFNLYFGLKSKFPNLKWLNLELLAKSYLKDHQKVEEIKYFTARVAGDPSKEKRQRTYLDALRTTRTQLIYGHYKSRAKFCYSCGHSWRDNEEKMTDVNIATHMIMDALGDKYDVAFLISGDSDLVPPIKAIRKHFKEKRVIVGFPPDRVNTTVKNAASGIMYIGRRNLAISQFSETVLSKSKYPLKRPKDWS